MNGASIKKVCQSLGWPGLAGLAALLMAAVLLLLANRWDVSAAQTEAEAARLSRQASAQKAGAGVPLAATPQQWQASLPSAALRQQRLADLLEMGVRAGLAGTRTEHRLTLDPASGLERLRVVMPVSGGYAQLRQFIGAALTNDPGLSLDSVKLRRATPVAPEIDAELVWSVHSRSDGAQP